MLDKTEFYINGSWVPSIDGRKFPVFNPATEDAFATIMLGGEKDAQAAIEAARMLSGLVTNKSSRPRSVFAKAAGCLYFPQ